MRICLLLSVVVVERIDWTYLCLVGAVVVVVALAIDVVVVVVLVVDAFEAAVQTVVADEEGVAVAIGRNCCDHGCSLSNKVRSFSLGKTILSVWGW